jgi:DNA polymerase
MTIWANGKKLIELAGDIRNCRNCALCDNGRALPDWSQKSKYVLIAEAPGLKETEKGFPLVGQAGRILWGIMEEYSLYRYMFGIINCVQCRPLNGTRNGKPTLEQMVECRPFIARFIKAVEPIRILLMGNYAKWFYDGIIGGVTAKNGEHGLIEYIPTTLSVHPAVAIYEGEKGKEKLRHAIESFLRQSEV